MIFIVYQYSKSIYRCLGQTDVNAVGDDPNGIYPK